MDAVLRLSLCAAVAWALAGCAVPPVAPAVAPAAAASAPSVGASAPRPAAAAPTVTAAAAPPATPPGPPTFVSVIREARRIDGLLTLWQKDEKVWIELRPEDLGKPMFLSPKVSQGIGEPVLFGGAMLPRRLVEFRRVNNVIQLVAVNRQFVARAGTPAARSVASGFASSLLASAAVASQPHPDRKAVLVEANAIFLPDLMGVAAALNRTYRQGYALDARNTHFASVRGTPQQVVFNVQANFATATLAVPQPGQPAGAAPSAPSALPDPRSMLVGLFYALGALPEQPMAPRLADPRIGHFVSTVQDFGEELSRTPRQRYVYRWRLEKKDPQAELSEPVKPITFWIDRSVPETYRQTMVDAVLEWNKAFEAIGFRDAIVAQVQPDDAEFDTLDYGLASIRWISSAQPAYAAIGPSHVDPRSGEILDADILIEGDLARSTRRLRTEVLGSRLDAALAERMQLPDAIGRGAASNAAAHADGGVCLDDAISAEQLGYALDVLEARGELPPDSPQAEEFAKERIRGTVMHEVGHALGLRHNFRASRAYTLAQLADPAFTAVHGTAASVMDYPALNLPAPGVPLQRHGALFRQTIGPYDYWAIEYAYRVLPAAEEKARLLEIAARSTDPLLPYGTDEDNSLGIDPESLTWDLADDPVAFARSRFAIARDLLVRQQDRQLPPDTDYSALRRSVRYALSDVATGAGVLARQIGGVRTLRDFPGSGRDPLVPVDAKQQRAALEALADGVLAADGFTVPAALERKLAPDFLERAEGAGETTDFSPSSALLAIQRTVLAQLMSDGVAGRVLDSQSKAANGRGAFQLSELYGRLTRAIWSDLGGRGDIPGPRRELQREHLNRLTEQLLRAASAGRADARALSRQEAQALLARIQAAVKRPGLSDDARAHLRDSAQTLTQALVARMDRAGV